MQEQYFGLSLCNEELWEITGGGTTDVGVWDSPATGYGEGIYYAKSTELV